MTWNIKKQDIPAISLGANLLSCGGGGDTTSVEALLMSILSEEDVIEVKTVADLSDEWVVSVGIMGSTVLFNEDIPSGDEGHQALLTYESVSNKKAGALISIEIGGVNALAPLVIANQTKLPVIDGDGMGRAFPELFMTSFHLAGISLSPVVLKTHDFNMVIDENDDVFKTTEKAKAFTKTNGGHSHTIGYGSTGKRMKTAMLPGTLNLALRLGKIIKRNTDVDEMLSHIRLAFENSIYGMPKVILRGVVSDVHRWFENEAIIGKLEVDGRSAFTNRRIEVEFKNEFISIKEDQYICTAPDLILLLNAQSLIPYSVVEVQAGLSVVVLAIPAPNALRTTDMLELVGPKTYQLSCPYQPFEGEG
ncbi:DUF917 domain-containing protein [Cytobacillus purgationiresistens]|uniref:DUF917 family protein n=1 Tax=Cytobacillus purgationiresistens TaxID=863449 RepID=A0ABU0ANC6_9BACI|nr:DUF917 family protein [Cytobacillus purgationiresistens]MDQ0272788.1 DUF917 family protein [Cytobacillus purgationiresistens]